MWTYSGNPASSNLDQVRFEIGDTQSTDPLLQDEEVLYTLSVEGNLFGAAARCCEVLARNFAREADRTSGKTRVSASQRSIAFAREATKLRAKASGAAAPYAGGTVDPQSGNPISPIFSTGMMDDPDVS